MPYRAGPNCWLYHATKKVTSVDGMRFCFTFGRVSVIQTAQHGHRDAQGTFPNAGPPDRRPPGAKS